VRAPQRRRAAGLPSGTSEFAPAVRISRSGDVRQGFFYGRSFVSDEDLNAQALSWMAHTANVRMHRTILEAPQTRFERDELLKPLAMQPYRSLILESAKPASRPRLHAMPIGRTPTARGIRPDTGAAA